MSLNISSNDPSRSIDRTSEELGLDLRKFDKANTPEARAKLNELVHDLEAFGKNAAKLHADLPKLAVTAPVLYATGRI